MPLSAQTELAEDVAQRRDALAERLRRSGMDGLLVASEANAHYLTGYETTFWGNKSKPFAVLFAPPARPVVLCHVGEEPSVRLDAVDVDVAAYEGPEVLTFDEGGVAIDYQLPAAEAVRSALDRAGCRVVGVEDSWHFLPGFTPAAWRRAFSGPGVETRDASALIWAQRRVKSPYELARMRRAAQVAAATHDDFLEHVGLGMTERELHRTLREAAYRQGAERIGYSGIVAGVDRAPLGGPTDRRWERGQLLFVDICLQLGGGYFADFNRIWASDTPTRAQRAGYASIVEALERARGAVRADQPVSAVADAINAGQESIYSRVGHGLGLEMPEPPSLSNLDPTPLSAGEVICLEPNVHDSEAGWLVSEEEVVVTRDGFELLSPPFPTQLMVVV